MTEYIIRRIIQAGFVAFIVSIMVFMAIRFLPGDPIYLLIPEDDLSWVSEEEIAAIRAEYGLDKPIFVQYMTWIGGVLKGDLGESIVEEEPVMDQLRRRLPVTIYLGLMSVFIATILGVTAGTICAIRYGTWIDTVVTVIANIGITVPIFWLGIIMVYFIGLKLGLLPLHGYTSPFEDFGLHVRQLVMPVFCLSIFSIAANARQTRSSMLEVLHQDYVRTAWAKGLKERTIITRHSLKNALIPVVTLVGFHLRYIFGGAVLIETIFNINGMGSLVVNAVNIRDYPVVQGTILFIAIAVVLINLAVDLTYGLIDPRIRYE